MMDWFKRRAWPRLPVSSAEIAEVLRAAAPFADTDETRAEYIAAADALDRVITQTRRHGSEPTRDALAYALGRAELNMKDQISELIEVSKETHLLVQGVHTAQAEQGAVVFELRAGFQSVGERITDNTLRIADLEKKTAEHDRTRDQSIEDRRLLRQDMDESKAHRTRIQRTLDELNEAIARIELQLSEHHAE